MKIQFLYGPHFRKHKRLIHTNPSKHVDLQKRTQVIDKTGLAAANHMMTTPGYRGQWPGR